MPSEVKSRVVYDGQKNTVVLVTGVLSKSNVTPELVFDLSKLEKPPSFIRLDGVTFSIEEKLQCMLWWEGKEDDLILPLAGRGKLEFYGGLHSPRMEGYTGNIVLSTSDWTGPVKRFMILLDMMRQQ